MRTGNLGLVKRINKNTVLNIIRDYKRISRANIAKVAGLNKATVSSLVDELIQEHYVIELGTGESTGGRRPLMLEFNRNAGTLIGVELGVNFILVVSTNLQARIIWKKQVYLKKDELQQHIVEKMVETIKEAIELSPKTPYGIIGIVVGVPGIVNHETGSILFAPNLNWDYVPIASMLTQQLPHYRIHVENEAKLAALGEKWFGSGKEYKNIVYISAGTGIGAGVILNEQLYTGVEGLAGEVGHHIIDVKGLKCSCGNYGCWEMYASEKALQNRLKPLLLEEYSIDSILLLARLGNSEINKVLSETGMYLGVGLLNIINSYNPEAIIIGNSLVEAGDLILDPAKKFVKKSMLNKANHPNIIKAQLGDKSCVIGAVSLILKELLSIEEEEDSEIIG
ncbi:ROK family protein [Litchfieldia alkalitelluris]|uniref:ROK family protein n=1 Tax=Litchfieldia alkalitelluris TaxID=304268 RepID=UPI0019578D4A|nr:ROK family protein [Litchfieldia alkalitelluris]